jgi:hypothetical protein
MPGVESRAVSIADTDGSRYWPSVRTCQRCGTPQRQPRRIASRLSGLIIKEVALDKKRRRGFVWIQVIWQTGAASEHWAQRTVQSYTAHADADRIRDRIIELNGMNKLDAEIAATLYKDGLRTAHGPDFSGNMIHLLHKRWGIKTVKINGTEANLQPGRMEVARFARPGEGQGAELVKDNEVLPIRIIRQTPLPSTAALGAG